MKITDLKAIMGTVDITVMKAIMDTVNISHRGHHGNHCSGSERLLSGTDPDPWILSLYPIRFPAIVNKNSF